MFEALEVPGANLSSSELVMMKIKRNLPSSWTDDTSRLSSGYSVVEMRTLTVAIWLEREEGADVVILSSTEETVSISA